MIWPDPNYQLKSQSSQSPKKPALADFFVSLASDVRYYIEWLLKCIFRKEYEESVLPHSGLLERWLAGGSRTAPAEARDGLEDSMREISIILIILLFANTAFSACLEGYPSVPQEYTKSFAVLIGTVISVEQVPESAEYFDGHNYTVKVGELLKGTLPDKVVIFSENSSGRFPLESGSTYILFVYKELGRLHVSNCGNSGLVSKSGTAIDAVRRLKRDEQK